MTTLVTLRMAGTLQNAGPGGGVTFQFARNINLTTTVGHDLERYRNVDFIKNRFTISGGINTFRWISFTGSYSDGNSSDVTNAVTWTSSDPSIATVSSDGILTALASGQVTIGVALQGTFGSLAITVQ